MLDNRVLAALFAAETVDMRIYVQPTASAIDTHATNAASVGDFSFSLYHPHR